MPDDVGGVTWFNCDDADMVAYVPLYCCITQVPDPFRQENNPRNEFSFESAFWMNNWVANMVYPRYSMMIGDLRQAQRELEDYYSAARYEEDVIKLLDELFRSHRRVILSGGSMMYIDAVCNGIDDIPTIDDEVRDTLKQRLATEGLSPLLAELRLLDPEHYNRVDHRNTRRVVHALEVCYTSGKPYSSFLHAGERRLVRANQQESGHDDGTGIYGRSQEAVSIPTSEQS